MDTQWRPSVFSPVGARGSLEDMQDFVVAVDHMRPGSHSLVADIVPAAHTVLVDSGASDSLMEVLVDAVLPPDMMDSWLVCQHLEDLHEK